MLERYRYHSIRSPPPPPPRFVYFGTRQFSNLSQHQPDNNNKDLYAVLGISRNATQTDIKRKYYALCHKYHPDKVLSKKSRTLQTATTTTTNLGSEDDDLDTKQVTEKFRQIVRAYEVLSNPTTRREYDKFGQSIYYRSGNTSNSNTTRYWANPETEEQWAKYNKEWHKSGGQYYGPFPKPHRQTPEEEKRTTMFGMIVVTAVILFGGLQLAYQVWVTRNTGGGEGGGGLDDYYNKDHNRAVLALKRARERAKESWRVQYTDRLDNHPGFDTNNSNRVLRPPSKEEQIMRFLATYEGNGKLGFGTDHLGRPAQFGHDGSSPPPSSILQLPPPPPASSHSNNDLKDTKK